MKDIASYEENVKQIKVTASKSTSSVIVGNVYVLNVSHLR